MFMSALKMTLPSLHTHIAEENRFIFLNWVGGFTATSTDRNIISYNTMGQTAIYFFKTVDNTSKYNDLL